MTATATAPLIPVLERRRRALTYLAATTGVALLLAFVALWQRSSTSEPAFKAVRMFPALEAKVDDIVTIQIETKDKAFNVTRDAKDASSNFNSINSRRLTYDYSIDLWKTKPLTGVGLRFWFDPNVKIEGRQTFGEPHDFVISALGETGVVGLAALAFLLWQMFGALRLAGGELGRLARLAFLGLLVDSLFGILWVAGTFTARMLVVGMAIGAAAAEKQDQSGTDDQLIDLRERLVLS